MLIFCQLSGKIEQHFGAQRLTQDMQPQIETTNL